MSKKKPAGGSTTMTLKDFHGGSIPSDLPLPSAPGVMVRPTDRAGFERQSAWGNPMGRPDQRLRPGSAGSVRNFDDKTPFLAHSVHIGRNFDEDERKPLDGVSAPRRTVCDENIISVPVCTELKSDYSSNGRFLNCQVASSVSYLGGTSAASYAGNTKEAGYTGPNSQNCVSNSGGFFDSVHVGGNYSGSGNSNINVWAMRKEVINSIETMVPKSSAPNTALKLAHASAVEKVTSGRWQSKQAMNHTTDVEIIRHGETESELHNKDEVIYNSNKSYLAMDVPSMMEYSDGGLASLADRALNVDDGIHNSEREFPVHDFSKFPKTSPVTSEINTSSYADGLQHSHKSELQPTLPSELSDRPKLKLLPRSKPLHSLGLPIEHKQQIHDSGHQVSVTGVRRNFNTNKAEPGGFHSGNQTQERPRLNLKPRSQPIEKFEANAERERSSVFGGARPRELVLKDHGLDHLMLNNQEGLYNNRLKQDIQTVQTHVSLSLYNENAHIENNRMKINNDRRENRGVDLERSNAQKRSWQKDNWRIRKDIEKQQPQERERPPSPETWRKPPAETHVKTPISAEEEEEVSGVHYGKAASALELAQVFSKSVSDTNSSRADQFPGQRGRVLTQGQIPFSRLTTSSPSPRPQINGY